jgi:hypothetical protein
MSKDTADKDIGSHELIELASTFIVYLIDGDNIVLSSERENKCLKQWSLGFLLECQCFMGVNEGNSSDKNFLQGASIRKLW